MALLAILFVVLIIIAVEKTTEPDLRRVAIVFAGFLGILIFLVALNVDKTRHTANYYDYAPLPASAPPYRSSPGATSGSAPPGWGSTVAPTANGQAGGNLTAGQTTSGRGLPGGNTWEPGRSQLLGGTVSETRGTVTNVPFTINTGLNPAWSAADTAGGQARSESGSATVQETPRGWHGGEIIEIQDVLPPAMPTFPGGTPR